MKSNEINKFRENYTKYEKECVFEGYRLAVLFDEKDSVKQHGGRWNQEEKTWWMPAGKILEQIHDNGTLVRDWLNDNEMIIGQFGKITKAQSERFTDEAGNFTEYGIHKSNNDPQFKVQFFYEQDVVKFIPTGMGELATEYLTLEDGRKRWDEAIEAGYIRVESWENS